MSRALIACLAAALAASPTSAQPLSGQWCGEGNQVGPGVYRSQWSARLLLKEGSGRMDYPSLQCGGALTFERTEGDVQFYREHIDYGHGRCLDGGLISIKPIGWSVRWEWLGSGAIAEAVLSPHCGLNS